MNLFLTSSFVEFEYEDGSRLLDPAGPLIEKNGFADHLRQYWKEPARILLMVSDPEDHEGGLTAAGRLENAFLRGQLPVDEILVYDHAQTRPLEDLIAWSDVVYLAGGHGPTQNAFFRECHLKQALSDYQGLVICLSAGSVNAANQAYLMPEKKGEAVDGAFIRFAKGLGLTDLQIIPHREYMQGFVLDGKHFIEDIVLPDSIGHQFFLIDDGSYFHQQDGITHFYGQGEILEDGIRTPLSAGRIIRSRSLLSEEEEDHVLNESYDMILVADPVSGRVEIRQHVTHPPVMVQIFSKLAEFAQYSRLIQFIAKSRVVPEEKQTFLEQMTLPAIIEEIEERGSFARTVHIVASEGRRALSIRAHLIGSYQRVMLTFQDISTILDHDWMTDEYARSGFLTAAPDMLRDAPQDQEYVLIYSNIKEFKMINDLFGEQSGDMVIFNTRYLLRSVLHPMILARLEADHFAMITRRDLVTPDLLRKLSHQTYVEKYKQYNYTIRYGIYPILDRKESIIHMLDCAKLTESSIRADLGETYAFYDDKLRDTYVRSLMLTNDIRRSLKEGDFQVYYQPVVSMSDEKICSAEALIRWDHPTLGMLSPGSFIPIFEKTGKISQLDLFTISHVADLTGERLAKGLPVVPCAVNLSRVDFYDPKLIEHILSRVRDGSLVPEGVKIEVTESAYAELESKAQDFLYELKDAGIQILLDDFGSGMSSLSTLESFAFDVVKLDMGFISKIGRTRKSELVIASVIELAHDTGSVVVAEGVESTDQWQFLKDAGCDMVQGFLKFRPMKEADFLALLERQIGEDR